MVADKPLPGVGEQECGLGQAFGDRCIGNRVAFVVVEIALLAQGVEHDYAILGEPNVFGKGCKAVWWWPGWLVTVR